MGSWRGKLFTSFDFSINETFTTFAKYFACWHYWIESVRSSEQSSCHFTFSFNCSQQYRKSISCCRKIIKNSLQTYRYRKGFRYLSLCSHRLVISEKEGSLSLLSGNVKKKSRGKPFKICYKLPNICERCWRKGEQKRIKQPIHTMVQMNQQLKVYLLKYGIITTP